MTDRIRFPQLTTTAGARAETDLVIELFTGSTLSEGGEVAYADISSWKLTDDGRASPFVGVVIEFTADGAVTIGDGTDAQAIGLFGEITGVGKYLLGLLGLSMGTAVPTVPIISATVGFAQISADVSLYDKLSVGMVAGALEIGAEVTVRARPIRDRFYEG